MENKEIFKCPICGKIFDYQKYSRPKTALTKHIPYCRWKKELLLFLNKQEITSDLNAILDEYGSVLNLYETLNNKFNVSRDWYYKLFKENNIDTSSKRANNSSISKQKREKTNLELYGSRHNFCKDHPSRKEWEERLLKEEGITNVFQRESVKQKSIETMISKYGVEHAAQFDAFKVTEKHFVDKFGEELGKKKWKELCFNRGKSARLSYYIEKYGEEEGSRIWKDRIKNLGNLPTTKISSLNIKFKSMLDLLNIPYESEYCIWLDDVQPRYYDFRIGKILIELNGDFWHAKQKKYKETDILNFPGESKTVKEVWERDRIKKELAEKNGFKVIYFWENQINNSEIWNKIVNKFTEYANNKNKIYKENTEKRQI